MAQIPATSANGTELLDGFTVFDAGMNSGIAPSLLKKNQLAWLNNGTVRGTYATPRPPWYNRAITYPDAATQAAVEQGRFQGSCWAQPDSGPESLLALISGRLFEFIIVGNVVTCFDRTIAGDPNDATAPQAWLWQAEKWVFVTNGVDLPLYFNTSTKVTVRSTGVPVGVIGTTAADFTIPAVGAATGAPVAATANWPANGTRVTFGTVGEFEITAGGGTPNATLQTISSGYVGSIIVTGSQFSYSVTQAQFPVGRQGAYWKGRVWMALADGVQFVAGDISGGPSGTLAENFRDAVLFITENSYLTGGGNFSIPGAVGKITAMVPIAELDVSLGQGQLAVLTPMCVFTVNCTTDRLEWQQMTNPILTVSLISNGGQGQYSTVPANGDTIFRSVDGIRSLILARREFATWGNVPISREMDRIVPLDNPLLLPFGSAIVLENRMLMTVGPVAADASGVYHKGFVALNFDPLSSLAGKAASVYDGLWTGPNALQLVKGYFNNVERGFFWKLNTDLIPNIIELWEIMPTPQDILSNRATVTDANIYDNGITPIQMTIESPELNCDETDPKLRTYKRLLDGVVFVDCLVGRVDFEAYYKPDQYSCWVPWINWTECATNDTGLELQFRPEMGMGTPDPRLCDPVTDRPFIEGFTFQFKLVVLGHCRIKGARFRFAVKADPKFKAPNCLPLCP